MDFGTIIAQLQQFASKRGGRMIAAIALTIFAILATVRYILWSGTLPPLQGGWQIAHNVAVLIFFLLLALIIASIIWPKPEVKPSSETVTNSPDVKRNRSILKIDRLDRWVKWWVLGWMLILIVFVYVFMGMMLIKDLIVPSIQNIASIPFEWETKYIIDNIMMPLIMTIFWLVLPFIAYLQIIDERQRKNDRENTKKKRRL